jgi:hypothetical protein
MIPAEFVDKASASPKALSLSATLEWGSVLIAGTQAHKVVELSAVGHA